MKHGLTKSYKGLIFISENAWAACDMSEYRYMVWHVQAVNHARIRQ